jgi:succinate dehydrogenase/fumarate reductase flavoprotein subunit
VFKTVNDIGEGSSYDFIVVGAGGAGLSAAVFASLVGKSVLVVENTEFVGGTTALSAGTVWIPNSQHSATVTTVDDSFEKASSYLTGVVGGYSDVALRDAFLTSGPAAIALLEARTEVRFRAYPTHPDYEQQVNGATMRGRALEPLPFDGRLLGDDLHRLRPPIPEFTLFGGMMVDRTDVHHLLNMKTSWGSFRHAATLLGRYAADCLKGPRGTRLVMGNALIGRLLLTLRKASVSIALEASVSRLLTGPAGVEGVTVSQGSLSRNIRANDAVILAAGGFNQHHARREQLLHHPVPPLSSTAPGQDGAMQDLALQLGARMAEGNFDHAYWAPVSMRKRRDGSTAIFPHFVLDRSKPGTVCVDQTGRRFVNESTSYHLFAREMFKANRHHPAIPCYIVTDAVGLKRYGLGMVRPGTSNLRQYLADGYLVEARTVGELARRLSTEPGQLEATVARMNEYAQSGLDPEFGRGTTAYHQINGDANAGRPNPTLGPIATAPFYAIRLYPSDIGAATGLVIDDRARVLDEHNVPINGLYACGNEANSIMGGTYPAPGITLGPALTFAYRAVQHATGMR